MTQTVTNWERIRRLAGPNSTFPGRRVYLFTSRQFDGELETAWLRRFRREANERGMEVISWGRHTYVALVPGAHND